MLRLASISVLVIFVLAGCEDRQPEPDTGNADLASTEFAESATARLSGLEGRDVEGMITFEEAGDHLMVRGSVSGLERGKHGFHVHSGMSCDDFGDHFNPMDVEHGSPDEPTRHHGDLGNLVADSSGVAEYERIDRKLSLTGEYSIAGRALIVHAGEDSYLDQPSGDAGPVIACGIITMD